MYNPLVAFKQWRQIRKARTTVRNIIIDQEMLLAKLREEFGDDIAFKDKVAPADMRRKYGTNEWAARDYRTQHDLDAQLVNANVYISTRAISDAVKSLPVHITTVESLGGVEREVEDTMHEANNLLRNPNPEHSWADIVTFIIKNYLNDGNAIMTIEPYTGPNQHVEIWPRDPRNVDINVKDRSYRFGSYTESQITYPRNRVIHIRDLNSDNPLWGVGRVSTVREEIIMDYCVKRFNSNFFRHGATLNLMFTPEHNLTEDQHQELLDALSADLGGVERAFLIFVNKYAGKFEFPEQKHKDIKFLDLLKHNRETIFGVFGLPPFRGGVMEYANYANALAQDADFWLNTIKPILKVIEDAINKQLLWPRYGEDVRIRFNIDSVPALRGSETEQIDRLLKLKDAGIVSAEYVRKKLDINESDAPDSTEDDSNTPDDIDDEATPGEDEKPTDDEAKDVENALAMLFQQHRVLALTKLAKLTSHGSLMSVLCDPEGQSAKIYDTLAAVRSIRNELKPRIRQIVMHRGVKAFSSRGVFDIDGEQFKWSVNSINLQIEDVVDQTLFMLRSVLSDADVYNWSYQKLQRHINGVFSRTRVTTITNTILRQCITQTNQAINDMKKITE